ncbi:MAG: hypothetical protein RL199_2490 [Pseudomonadota bacterium]|jgi:hypothetical protein
MQGLDRRTFLKAAFGVGAAATSLVALGGCSSGPKALSCTDTAGLSPAELAMRQQLKYVDQAPDAAKACSGCQFFQSKGPDVCGGCTLVKGPINPKGWCSSWVQKAG